MNVKPGLILALWVAACVHSIQAATNEVTTGTERKSGVLSSETNKLAVLLENIERENAFCVKRDPASNIVSVVLTQQYLKDENLALLANLKSLRSLAMGYNRKLDQPTESGIAALQNAPELKSLNIRCCGQFSVGMMEGIAKLRQLENLTFVAAHPPEANNYTLLTNLVNLRKFTNSYSIKFGPDEVLAVANLRQLRQLEIWSKDLSQADCLSLFSTNGVTNLIVRGPGWTMHLTRP